jgi:hypothetical protein
MHVCHLPVYIIGIPYLRSDHGGCGLVAMPAERVRSLPLIAGINGQMHRLQVQFLSQSSHVGGRHRGSLIAPAIAYER